MPTVLRIGPYRFHFYAADGAEPPHVHVAGPYSGSPKFWLEPVSLAEAAGVAPRTLREIQRHIEDNRDHLNRSWHEFFRPLSHNYGLHATRAWVVNRTVHVALDNGRVVGLPARQHHVLATLTDDQLATLAIRSHESGDAIEWRTGPGEFDRFSLAVWDVVEGTPRAVRAWVDRRTVLFELADGRVFGFPAANFDRLRKASDAELAGVEVQADGYGLRWDDPVDEDISVPGVVAGRVQGP